MKNKKKTPKNSPAVTVKRLVRVKTGIKAGKTRHD